MAYGTVGVPAWTQPDPRSEAKARALLERSSNQAGGRDAWLALPPVSATLTDTWSRAAMAFRPPTPDAPARFTIHFEQDKARIDFLDTESTCWGFDSREAWTSRLGLRTYTHVHHAARTVPALKWFAAMPHKLLDPDVQAQMFPGASSAGPQVLVQFGTQGNRTGDRMLASFSSRDGTLVKLAYTARELGETVMGLAEFATWERVEGVQLPSEVKVGLLSPAALDLVQRVQFKNWTRADVAEDHFEKPPDSPSAASP